MVVFSPGLKWGLFCHEHVLVEKLDNASRIHLSLAKALTQRTQRAQRKKIGILRALCFLRVKRF
jgi:hypothetical protein